MIDPIIEKHIELWDRQPSDTSESFEAFCVYRDMGPHRSNKKVANKLNRSLPLMLQWCAAHNWVKRVAAYDSYMDVVRRGMMEKELSKQIATRVTPAKMDREWVLARAQEVSDKCLDEAHWSPHGALRGVELIARIKGYLSDEPTNVTNIQQNYLTFVKSMQEMGKDNMLAALPQGKTVIDITPEVEVQEAPPPLPTESALEIAPSLRPEVPPEAEQTTQPLP